MPLIAPASVTSFERFTTKLLLFTMAPATVPAVPPEPKYSVPPEMVVLPVKVLFPVRTKSALPVLVKLPVLVAMTPPTVTAPSVCSVKPKAPENALPVVGVIDKLPASTCISVAAARVIFPVSVLASDKLRSAPLLDTPVPDSVRASARVMPPAISNAPAVTVVPPAAVPKPPAWVTRSTPPLTVVAPVKVLLPVKI